MNGGLTTPLQEGLLLWRDLLDHLRDLDEQEQVVLLDILTIGLARQIARRALHGDTDDLERAA